MTHKAKPSDLKVIVDWEDRVIDIRQSAIQDFLDCRRKFFWTYIEGIEFDYDDGPRPWVTADTGSAFHAGIGAYYEGKNPDAAIGEWVEVPLPGEGGFPSGNEVDLARIMVEGHIEDLAEDGKDIGENTVAVEDPIEALVEDIHAYGTDDLWSVRVHGRVDRRIETEDGINILDDWKSVAVMASTLDYIQQLGRYAVLVRAATGWRADRIRSTQVKRVKRTKDGPFYTRPWLPFTEAMYVEHAQNLRDQLTDIVTCIVDDGPWYEHVTGECDWKCRVSDICKAQQQGDDVEMMVEIHYRDKVAR